MLPFTALWVALVFNVQPSNHSLSCLPGSNPRHFFAGEWQQSKSLDIPQRQGSSRCLSSNYENDDCHPLYLNLNVGGLCYTVKRSLLLKFPDSYFGNLLKSGWTEVSDGVVDIQRDGELFYYVHEFMFYGKLPRNELGISFIDDASLLRELMQEAEFYNLPGLVTECKTMLQTSEAEQSAKHYMKVISKIGEVKSSAYFRREGNNVDFVYKSGGPDSLISLLRSKPYASAWVTGTLDLQTNFDPEIFMSTTVMNVNVPELLDAAVPSRFGRGMETVLDTNVRDSMEIPASNLCDLTVIVNAIDVSALASNMKLKLEPYKLVIYEEGGHFEKHRDTVRGERHVGTLVLILNSQYSGGELEVCHSQQKVLVAGACKWVAMYGDCVHSIRPVTSGTRVSLIFDIWNESDDLSRQTVAQTDVNDGEEEADKEENREHEEHDDGFWPKNEVNTGFWRNMKTEWKSLEKASFLAPTVGPVDVWKKIYKAVDNKLEKYATVSICLEHLYPLCQANPDFLKGEDYKLYQMLKSKYSLGVTAIVLERNNYFAFNGVGYCELASDKLLDGGGNILLIPNAMDRNSLFYHLPYVEFTGNESQGEELVYLVAALVVRKQ